MILTLFGVLVSIALVLIILGLARPTESAQALIGFTLLFLLSLTIISSSLQYESGSVQNTTYGYDTINRVNYTSADISYSLSNFDDTTSHQVGYYLAIASVIGSVGVFVGIKGRKQDD